MSPDERQVLHDILNGLENLAKALDSCEAILIRKGVLLPDEIDREEPLHVFDVGSKLVSLRAAIDRL